MNGMDAMDQGTTPQEKRSFVRIRANFTLIYEVEQPPEVKLMIGDEPVAATMLDLSEGGIGILTAYEIPKGTILSIKFTLIVSGEALSPVFCQGEVCYLLPFADGQFRLGVRFLLLQESGRRSLAQFITRSGFRADRRSVEDRRSRSGE